MISELSPRDIASIYAIGCEIRWHYNVSSIEQLAKKLNVSLSTENRNRKTVLARLNTKPIKESPKSDRYLEVVNDSKVLVRRLMEQAYAVDYNESIPTYAPWLLRMLKDLHSEGIQNTVLSELTGISRSCIARSRDLSFIADRRELSKVEIDIERVWHASPHRYKKTLHKFYNYYIASTNNHEVTRSYMRDALLRLGLREPRGPKEKNSGVEKKQTWEPNALWSGDGKFVDIVVNGKPHRYVWYAFIDEGTTLLVGSSLGKTETATEIISALEEGKCRSEENPIGILVDNRAKPVDKSLINKYCKERGILLVNTFPGNSKSNGIIEGNFSIFESHVGNITVTGKNEEEIARSIAKEVVEIFTQLRNAKVRQNKGARDESEPLLSSSKKDSRSAIEKLARRLKKKEINLQKKWDLLEPAKEYWSKLPEENVEKFIKVISKFTNEELTIGQSIYVARCKMYPEKNYDFRYFVGILRNRRDKIGKKAFVEAFSAGCKTDIEIPDATLGNDVLTQRLSDAIADISLEKTPLRRRVFLTELVFLLFQLLFTNRLQSVWSRVLTNLTNNPQVSLKCQEEIVSFLYERIGPRLMANVNPVVGAHSSIAEKAQSPPKESLLNC